MPLLYNRKSSNPHTKAFPVKPPRGSGEISPELILRQVSRAIPVANVAAAVTAAAKLVLGAIARQLADRRAAASALSSAILPVYGITWGRSAISAVGNARINSISASLRNPPPQD